MNIMLVLIPLSLVLLCAGIWAFFWSVNHAQFDDLETPGLMPLCDDAPAASTMTIEEATKARG